MTAIVEAENILMNIEIFVNVDNVIVNKVKLKIQHMKTTVLLSMTLENVIAVND